LEESESGGPQSKDTIMSHSALKTHGSRKKWTEQELLMGEFVCERKGERERGREREREGWSSIR